MASYKKNPFKKNPGNIFMAKNKKILQQGICCFIVFLISALLLAFNTACFTALEDTGPAQEPEVKPAEKEPGEHKEEEIEIIEVNIYLENNIDRQRRNLIIDTVKKSIIDYNDAAFKDNVQATWKIVGEKTEADIVFMVDSFESKDQLLEEPVYFAAAVSFFSLIEELSLEDFKKLWAGQLTAVQDIEGSGIEAELVMDSQTLDIFEKILGKCTALNLNIITASQIEETLKQDVQTIALIPFEDISVYYKVLTIDGKSLLDKNVRGADYPLAWSIGADFKNTPADKKLESIIKANFKKGVFTNRQPGDFVSIIMTGVTAMSRQVAGKMNEEGATYPAERVRGILLDADITHISNEVSFVEDCYAARPKTTVFCSSPEYMELLEYIDVDVIELTGNHLNDYGAKWLEYTIDMYDEAEIPYFGGGRDLEDALKPAKFEINGYKFAFIGANSFGPSYAWATENSAGSAPINTLGEEQKEQDMLMYEEMVESLASQGHNVIFTFQYLETYSYLPTGQQVIDFDRMAEAGAVIVSGSQAHQPQGVKINPGSFINYGLGNLFFAQHYSRGHPLNLPVRQGIIAKHFFYEGKLINTVLITAIMEKGHWQPYQTYGDERASLLKSIFAAGKN